MYRRTRLRLTAWYAATLLAVLLVLGGGTYLGLVWALDREVDAGIRAAVDDWRATAPRLDQLRSLDVERHIEDPVDVFLLVFRADGALVANPRGFEAEELVKLGAVDAALSGRELWATVDEHGRFRIHAAPLVQEGRVAGAVIGGRSLEARDESVRTIIGVLGVVSGAGFVLALAASYVLAGRAMTPLRQAHDRERAFVGDASHELRSPLTLARALAELLQRGKIDADQRATTEQLLAVIDEAAELVDDLLVLARSEDVSTSSAAGSVDLAAEAAQTLDRMQPLLEGYGCRVVPELQPAPAAISEAEIRRILAALIENVLAHAPRGAQLRVRTHREGGSAFLAVADDGPGVPADQLGRIFERFTQVNVARTPGASHGVGLGLAIVAAIAQRRHGHASARRSDLGGLEVEVRLPAA